MRPPRGSHRCESLTPCHRQLSLSFAPSGFIVLDGLTPLFESFSVPSVSCTTCSTAPSYLLLVTCKLSLRGCCGLFNGFGFSSLILVLCFWFFFSIFVVFRQNGFQSATRWVSSSGCCSFVFLGGFRFSSEIMCSLWASSVPLSPVYAIQLLLLCSCSAQWQRASSRNESSWFPAHGRIICELRGLHHSLPARNCRPCKRGGAAVPLMFALSGLSSVRTFAIHSSRHL